MERVPVAVINFNCPHCYQNIDTEEDLAGLRFPCPACQKTLQIPAESEAPLKPVNFDCPYCTQNIDAPPEMAGMEIPCPTCKGKMLIPFAGPYAAAHSPLQPPDERKNRMASAPMAHLGHGTQKGSTIRIDLPEALAPLDKKRQVVIKRNAQTPKKRITYTAPAKRKPPVSTRVSKPKRGFLAWLRGVFGG